MTAEEYISKKTAAQEIDVNVRTIERIIEKGDLKKYKFGHITRISRREFEEYKKRHFVNRAS